MSILGRWRNEYGSILDIRAHAASGEFRAVYASDTGASGTYAVSGWAPRDAQGNAPFTAALSWRPLEGGEPDPSWRWLSIMTGVLFLDPPSRAPRIQTLHGLVASAPLAVVEISQPSVFTESLTFERIAEPGAETAAAADPAPRRGGQMALASRDPASPYNEVRLVLGAGGDVSGWVEGANGAVPVSGFMDPETEGLRGLALAAMVDGQPTRTVGFGGFIDTLTGSVVLETFEARAVRFANKYMGVTIGQARFTLG